MNKNILDDLIAQVEQAYQDKHALRIQGGQSKSFYGPQVSGEVLDVTPYQGILSYEPTELVITACCGTKLSEINETLAKQGQYLPFEPPAFSDETTVGGMLAAGLSGPRRAAVGAVRDFVLGTRVLNGQGQDLRFGGQVMKNVAGFDLSRLMVGALGTLGVVLEASFKLLPLPPQEISLRFELTEAEAIKKVNEWAGKGMPITASYFRLNELIIRLSGFPENLKNLHAELAGETVSDAYGFWLSLQDQTHEFFKTEGTLWRIATPPATAPLELEGQVLHEWGGAQRWLISSETASTIRDKVKVIGGHATAFKNVQAGERFFTPLPIEMKKLQNRIKTAMDPLGILNPGKIPLD